ncbi:hypothetical protein EVAR_95019_1 [Eumeta japonica]|uniref:Uncharacterized protein n=1 Tax=Eumeta variegata TaxID=151549 RepID=A0A4C1VU40_EUMVA|nr:hypothetical protein EVAR_95019_1 [Eumeta japonica]
MRSIIASYIRATDLVDPVRCSVLLKMLTYSSDFGAARLDPCELYTVVPYTYTLSERSAELHSRRSGGVLGFIFVTNFLDSVAALKARDKSYAIA